MKSKSKKPKIIGAITLGDIAHDPQTGFEGQVFADCKFLHGCRRLTLQPSGLLPNGQPIKAMTFDEPALELLEKVRIPHIDGPIDGEHPGGGGPRPEPDRGIDPGMEFQADEEE